MTHPRLPGTQAPDHQPLDPDKLSLHARTPPSELAEFVYCVTALNRCIPAESDVFTVRTQKNRLLQVKKLIDTQNKLAGFSFASGKQKERIQEDFYFDELTRIMLRRFCGHVASIKDMPPMPPAYRKQ